MEIQLSAEEIQMLKADEIELSRAIARNEYSPGDDEALMATRALLRGERVSPSHPVILGTAEEDANQGVR